MSQFGFDGTICPILDARRGQVYGASFTFTNGELPTRLSPDVAIKLEEFIKTLPTTGRLIFVGDGVATHAEKIAQLLGERALIAPSHIAPIRASAGCVLAEKNPDSHVEHEALMPIYLRQPQAVREREEQLRALGEHHD